jgi:hypothetical protein
MIESLYDETVDVKRLTQVDDGSKKDFQAFLDDVACHIQPLEDNITQDITTGFGKDLLMFCAVADIREGDRVERTISSVVYEYRVVAVENYNNFFRRPSHMELRIRAFKS